MDSRFVFSVRRPRLPAIGVVTLFILEDSSTGFTIRLSFPRDGAEATLHSAIGSFGKKSGMIQILATVHLDGATDNPEALRAALLSAGFAEKSVPEELAAVETESGEVTVWLPVGLADELREAAMDPRVKVKVTRSLLDQLVTPELESAENIMRTRRGFRFGAGAKAKRDFETLLRRTLKRLDAKGDWPWVVEAELALRLISEPSSDVLLSKVGAEVTGP